MTEAQLELYFNILVATAATGLTVLGVLFLCFLFYTLVKELRREA